MFTFPNSYELVLTTNTEPRKRRNRQASHLPETKEINMINKKTDVFVRKIQTPQKHGNSNLQSTRQGI